MVTRAKFEVSRVAETGYGGKRSVIYHNDETGKWVPTGVPIREITLTAVCDDGLAKENKSFATATPSGTITFQLNNPFLEGEFKPGQAYYVDFTPVGD